MQQMTPVDRRVLHNASLASHLLKRKPKRLNALAALLEAFETEDSYAQFIAWKKQEVSQLFIQALQGMAVTNPIVSSEQDAAIQYGITLGLDLARTVLEDPALIFQACFSKTENEEPEIPGIESDYNTPPQ